VISAAEGGEAMLISKARVIEAVKILDLVPVRPGIPSSEFIKVENSGQGVRLSLTSDAVGSVYVPGSEVYDVFANPFYIDRRVLMPFLFQSETGRSDEVVVERDKDVVEFKIGRRKLKLDAVPKVAGYGEITRDESAVMIKFDDQQRELMLCALAFTPTEQGGLPQLQCVCLTGSKILASNDNLIFVGNSGNTIANDLMMPLLLVGLLVEPSLREITAMKDAVAIEFKSGKIMQPLPSQALKDFPKKKILDIAESDRIEETFNVEATKFLKVLERFAAFMQSVKDKLIVLSGKEDDTVIKIFGIASHAKVSDSFSAIRITRDFKCEWPVDSIMPYIAFLAKSQLNLSAKFDDKSPYYLRSKVSLLVVSRKAN